MTVEHVVANQPPGRFYRGGRRIAGFRADGRQDRHGPEDWVASTTTLFGHEHVGLSVLGDGVRLRDAVTKDPLGWLGAHHLAAFGPETELLVKLLDAGQRLPVHAHPDARDATRLLGLTHGKTEAWVMLEPATVHLGFLRPVGEHELASWVANQDATAMLAAMHAVPLATGDAVWVPAGMPHSIGAGAFLVELQEPTDLSVLLEWVGFDIDGHADGHLGVGFDTALTAVDRRAWSREEITALRQSRAHDTGDLLPAAHRFFRAERLRGGDSLDPGYGVLVVVAGEGEIVPEVGDPVVIRRGQTLVVPHRAGTCQLQGENVEVIRCRPPKP